MMPPDESQADPATGAQETAASYWLHAFDVPGVYDLSCAPHEAFGMPMPVVVGDRAMFRR